MISIYDKHIPDEELAIYVRKLEDKDDELEQLRAEKDAILAHLRLPGLENNGGPGDILEDIKMMQHNHRVEVEDLDARIEELEKERDEQRMYLQRITAERGHYFTDTQIATAWRYYLGQNEDIVGRGCLEMLEECFGIERCAGCGGSGRITERLSQRASCPDCSGEGFKIGG